MDSATEEWGQREEASEEGGQRWEDMTQEALVEVFLKLGFEDKYRNVALVCKAWRRAVTDPACWVEVDMETSFEKRQESDYWWSPEFEKCMDSMIQAVVGWSSFGLRRLHTRHCSDNALAFLSSRCPNLQFLHIQMSQNVTDGTMSLLASKCPQLESVDLSECRGLSADTMRMLGRHCNGLIVLKRNMLDSDGNCRLRSIIPLRYLQLVPMGDQEGPLIAEYMPHLKHLEMCHSTIHDQSLVMLVEGCKDIEFLDLRGCKYLTGRGLDQAQRELASSVHFKRPIIPDRSFQIERYGHWRLYDHRFSLQYLEL